MLKKKPWMLLAACAGALAAVVYGWRVNILAQPSPSPEEALVQKSADATTGFSAAVDRWNTTTVEESNAASSPRIDSGSIGSLSSRRSEDPASRQLLVQAALYGDRKGLATRAAIAIGHCMTLEASSEDVRDFDAETRAALGPEAMIRIMNWQEQELRLCQALDEYSRAQWLQLLRRALGEGHVGDAAQLLMAFDGSAYERQVAAEVLKTLRADAFSCDESSLVALYHRSLGGGFWLTGSESVAVWQILKTLYAAKPETFWRDLGRDLARPRHESDPTEVQAVVDGIKPHC